MVASSFPAFAAQKKPVLLPRNYFLGVTPQESTYNDKKAVIVSEVIPGSPAARYGIKLNDIITALDGKPVTTPEELIMLINVSKGTITVSGVHAQDKTSFTLLIPLDSYLDMTKHDKSMFLVVDDQFNKGAGHWPLHGSDRLEDGLYTVDLVNGRSSSTSGDTFAVCQGNYLVEAVLTRKQGHTSPFGIHIGAADFNTDYIFFLISPQGEFTVINYLHKRKKSNVIVPWTKSDLLHTTGFNTLTVTRMNGAFAFYINGTGVLYRNDLSVTHPSTGIVYDSGTLLLKSFQVYRDVPLSAPAAGTSFNTPARQEKDVSITGIAVVPRVVRPGALFDLQISTLIKDSSARGGKVLFSLTYTIKRGTEKLLTKKIPFTGTEGIDTVSTNRGMKAGTAPGSYVIEVTIEYGGLISTKSTEFTIQ